MILMRARSSGWIVRSIRKRFTSLKANPDFAAGAVAQISAEMGAEDPLSFSLDQTDQYLKTHPEMLEHKVDQTHAQTLGAHRDAH
jgi:hypothetical protein